MEVRIPIGNDENIFEQSLAFVFDEIIRESAFFSKIDDLRILISFLLLLVGMFREEVFKLRLCNGQRILIILVVAFKKPVLLSIELSNTWIIVIDVSERKFALVAAEQIIVIFDEEML